MRSKVVGADSLYPRTLVFTAPSIFQSQLPNGNSGSVHVARFMIDKDVVRSVFASVAVGFLPKIAV